MPLPDHVREGPRTKTSTNGRRNSHMPIPIFIKGDEGRNRRYAQRSRTGDWKAKPIKRRAKELLGVTKMDPRKILVETIPGISFDEAIRMKRSPDS